MINKDEVDTALAVTYNLREDLNELREKSQYIEKSIRDVKERINKAVDYENACLLIWESQPKR